MVGKTLGHYEILEPLGAGGMGEVYRARDTTLKREVAIKVLPEDLAADPDRLARLEREAHLLAALNHPNIATIHSLEQHKDTRFLVLELVKGESLQQRLAKGPLGIETALDLCKQIAEALEAAHGEGIIHRDLKPANVLITPQGKAKVLDFGLAKAFEASASAGDITQSPTLTVAGTQTGVILGTAPYMSPEQVRGLPLDKRVDIWAFGCVVYEALTASRAFARETVADTLAAILESEPNWGALPAAAPPIVGALAKRCLRKDPDRRLHDIADARIEIEEALSSPMGSAEASGRPPSDAGRSRALPWAVAAIAIVVAAVAIGTRPSIDDGSAAGALAFPYRLPPGLRIDTGGAESGPLIAPGGDRFYFIARANAGRKSVWAWKIGDLAPVPLAGTEGANWLMALSPDGGSLVYDSRGVVQRIQTSGTGSSTIIDPDPGFAAGSRGAAWMPEFTLAYQWGGSSGLDRVSLSGGVPTPLTLEEDDDTRHYFPQLLPGGKSILLTIGHLSIPPSEWSIAVASVEGGEPQVPVVLWERATYGRYAATSGQDVSTGHLLFTREDSILAIPFDLGTMQASGIETSVISDMRGPNGFGHRTGFDFAENGTLVYFRRPIEAKRQLQLVNMSGEILPLDRPYGNREFSAGASARFAPGDADLLVLADDEEGNRRLSIYRSGRLDTRIPLEGGSPVWSTAGQRLAFTRDLGSGATGIMIVDLTGDDEPTQVLETRVGRPLAFSNDDAALIYHAWNGNDFDIREYIFATGEEKAWQATRGANEGAARLSPNGEWLAYSSGKSGRGEVYLRAYSPGLPGGDEIQVSADGGSFPQWGADGNKLFYLRDGEMMVVEIGADPASEVVSAVPLFDFPYPGGFEVVPDGSGFLTWREVDDPNARGVEPVVVLNWFEELKERVPTGR